MAREIRIVSPPILTTYILYDGPGEKHRKEYDSLSKLLDSIERLPGITSNKRMALVGDGCDARDEEEIIAFLEGHYPKATYSEMDQ